MAVKFCLRQFGRSALLIPNGVDCDRFFPGPPAHVRPTAILAPTPPPVSAKAQARISLLHKYRPHPAWLQPCCGAYTGRFFFPV